MDWKRVTAALVAATWMATNSGCVSNSATEGHAAKDDLVGCVGEASASLASTRDSMKTTMATYVDLVEMKHQDPVLVYQDFADALESTREEVETAMARLDDMEEASEVYFGHWQADFEQYKGETMRLRAEERLQTVRSRFGAVQKAVDPARERAAAWLDELDDQMLFLKYDLSREAVAALRDDAYDLSQNGRQLLETLETAMKVSDRFVRSMKNGSMAPAPGEEQDLGRPGGDAPQTASARPAAPSEEAPESPETEAEADAAENLDLSGLEWLEEDDEQRRR